MANIPLLEQSKTFVNKLTLTQKIIFGSVLGVILIGLIIIMSSAAPEEKMKVLYSNLSEQDAAKIVEQLDEKQIDYELEDGGQTILVKEDVVYKVRLDMANQGLPESSVAGYEIFDQANLGMSEFVQKLNYRRALEGELSKTIVAMNDVQSARVHIVIPEKTLFEKDQKEPTASVTLHMENRKNIGKVSVEGIQNLVASSVEGMLPDAVKVLDNRGKILSPPPLDNKTVAGLTSQQYQQQTNVEQYLSGKVQSLLDGVLGHGNSEVRVNAELDFTQIEKTITDFDPEGQVVRSEQQIINKSESTDSLSYPAVNMAKDEANSISNYEVSKSVQKIIEGVGTLDRLSVAVLINGKYDIQTNEDGTKELLYVERPEEEMNKLEQIVRNAVGYDPTRNDQVSVLQTPFDTMIDQDKLREVQKLPWYQQPDYIKLFALVGAMLIAFFLMFRLLQSKYLKDRMRVAFRLPAKIEVKEEELPEDEDEVEEEEEEEPDLLGELELDDEDILLLPTELPDQLLLEGDSFGEEEEGDDYVDDAGEAIDKDALAARAKAELEGEPQELSEESLMKLEIKNKVQDFIEESPQEAIKLLRVFLQQDIDERAFKL
jgi:flagellar M-ring protein FliF